MYITRGKVTVLSTCGWCRKVGCVIELHSCLGRFAIYVGHMLPRLLQLAVKYWTSHPGSGEQQQLLCSVSKAPTQDWRDTYVLSFCHSMFKQGFSICTISTFFFSRSWIDRDVLLCCTLFLKARACGLLLRHVWSLGILRDPWLTFLTQSESFCQTSSLISSIS